MKLLKKNIENWRSWKIDILFWFFVFGYWVFQFFLHYGWFLQNLGKDFIPSSMHTTVDLPNFLQNEHVRMGHFSYNWSAHTYYDAGVARHPYKERFFNTGTVSDWVPKKDSTNFENDAFL